MQISIIIPVYNAESYVQQAVESALAQTETKEIILVEDDSPDNSLAVCQVLAKKYAVVYLYQHPNGENQGAGDSRNLAIQKSTCDYIAFLDADDYFLPDRFTTAKGLFAADPTIDGVYEAIDAHFETVQAAQMWEELGRKTRLMLKTNVSPESLFEVLVEGKQGGFTLDGLVVKRSIFNRTGWFDEMRLHQDSAMMIKMAAMGRLVPGRLKEPVAKLRVHDHNRWAVKRPPTEVFRTQLHFWHTLWRWSKVNLAGKQQQLILNSLLSHGIFARCFNKSLPGWTRGLQKRLHLMLLVFDHPELAIEKTFWRRFMPGFQYWKKQLKNLVTLFSGSGDLN